MPAFRTLRSEIVEAVEPGPLEVQDEGLFLDGRPLVRTSPSPGSIVRFLHATGGPPLEHRNLVELRRLLSRGTAGDEPLSSQFRLLIGLLVPGRYRLSLARTKGLYAVVWPPADPSDPPPEFYPGPEACFLATQPRSGLDPRRIRIYERAILRGLKPLVVTAAVIPEAGDNRIDWVIDGHHKLAASEAAGAQVHVVQLTEQSPRPLNGGSFGSRGSWISPSDWLVTKLIRRWRGR